VIVASLVHRGRVEKDGWGCAAVLLQECRMLKEREFKCFSTSEKALH